MQQQTSPKQCKQEPDRADSQVYSPERQIRDIAASIYRGHTPLSKGNRTAFMVERAMQVTPTSTHNAVTT